MERSKFDALLLDHSREQGADVRYRTRVAAVASRPGGHEVDLEGPRGAQRVSARWVIDASGREAADLFPQKRVFDPCHQAKRVAIYSHFTGVARPLGRGGGDTVAVRLDDGWFWLIPIDAERTSVGLVTAVEPLRKSGETPEKFFLRTVEGAAKLRELFQGAVPTMPYRVTSDYSYFRKDLAGDRLLLVGDAAGSSIRSFPRACTCRCGRPGAPSASSSGPTPRGATCAKASSGGTARPSNATPGFSSG